MRTKVLRAEEAIFMLKVAADKAEAKAKYKAAAEK
jgi:hypothetical protein